MIVKRPDPQNSILRTRRGFTLMELLMVLLIITIIAGMSIAALAGATEAAREARTRSMISKLDQLIMEKWERFRDRPVPVKIPATITDPNNGNVSPTPISISGRIRLYGIRDMMRMELPDRVTDVVDTQVVLFPAGYVPTAIQLTSTSSIRAAYIRKIRAATNDTAGNAWATLWTEEHQGAECLYLIVSCMQDGDKSALDFFSQDEIGDTDGDGMKEFLDGWKQPIEFLRWAPGFTIENGVQTMQSSTFTPTPNGNGYRRVTEHPDPFDPLRVDLRWNFFTPPDPPLACFALHPLIMSAGRDKVLDIELEVHPPTQSNPATSSGPFYYARLPIPNDPYYIDSHEHQLGTPGDADDDGALSFGDNITNHYQETP